MAASDLRIRSRLRPAALVGVAVAGAALGSAWDLLHVRTHTTVYAIGIDRMPWWVPLEFAVVYLAGVIGIVRFGAPSRDVRARARLSGEIAWVTAVYAITAFLHRYELLVLGVAALALLVRRRTFATLLPRSIVPAAALVVLGPAVEAVLIAMDVFRYSDASFGNIPLWLPLLYANAVPFAVRLAECAIEEPA